MILENFTLLYVEDDYNAQEQMKFILEEETKELYQAYDGEEGLEMYKKHSPDIVLTDINMPVMDGLMMTQKIKEIDKDQPIIILSAFDDRETLLRAIQVGIESFVPKPVDVELLLEKLEKAAQNLQNKLDAEELRERKLKELYTLAHYDNLTNIPNRYLFNIKFDEAISRANRRDSAFTLLFVDLDNFKQINDTYGHAAGDAVLQSVANNIKSVIRLEDTLARISGDEFALIIEDEDNTDYIRNLSQKIQEAVSQPIEFQNKTLRITCSIGSSRYPHDSTSKDELLHLADIAMYKFKNEHTERDFL